MPRPRGCRPSAPRARGLFALAAASALLALLAGCAPPPAGPALPATPGRMSPPPDAVEFRITSGRALPGYRPIGIKGKDVEVFVSPEITLTRAHIRKVRRLSLKDEKSAVGIDFNDEGTRILAKVTAENITNYLGVIVDGELVANPFIADEIPYGSIMFEVSPEEADDLVRRLSPPGRAP